MCIHKCNMVSPISAKLLLSESTWPVKLLTSLRNNRQWSTETAILSSLSFYFCKYDHDDYESNTIKDITINNSTQISGEKLGNVELYYLH